MRPSRRRNGGSNRLFALLTPAFVSFIKLLYPFRLGCRPAPTHGGATGHPALLSLAFAAWLTMAAAYWPLVHFYRLPPVWTLTLPAAGALFLAMTVGSAVDYWRGTRASWKARLRAIVRRPVERRGGFS